MRKMAIKIPTVRLGREIIKVVYFSVITFVLQWNPVTRTLKGKEKQLELAGVELSKPIESSICHVNNKATNFSVLQYTVECK